LYSNLSALLFRILEKNRFEDGYMKQFAPERVLPRDVGRRRTPSARVRRGAGIPHGLRPGAVGTVHLRPLTCANGLGRCHADFPHSPAGEPPASIGRWPPHVTNRLRAHAVATVANESSAKSPWSAAGL
jgi:hypothetical protein